MTSLAQLLKDYRARYHLSQLEASNLFRVPLRTWEGWERRTRPLSNLHRLLLSL